MKTFFLICFIPVLALSQPFTFRDPAFMVQQSLAASSGGSGFSPTNISGLPLFAWYRGDDYNFGTGNWIDAANGKTAVNTYGTKPAKNNLGAHYSVGFTSSYTSLERATPVGTNSTVFEIYLLMNPKTINNNDGYLTSVGNVRFYCTSSGTKWFFCHGSTISANVPVSNNWIVVNYVINGSTGQIFTNNVSAGTTTGNDDQLNGNFDMGTYNGNGFSGDFAECGIFMTNLSTSARSGLYNYLKTNYPAASLP